MFNLFLTSLCELLQPFFVIILHVRILALGVYASPLAYSCFSCWCDCSIVAFIMVFEDNVSHWKVLRTPLFFLYSHLPIPLHWLSFMNVQFFLLPLTQVNHFKYISCSTLRSGSLLDEFLITLTQITLVIIFWGPVVFAWSCRSCSCSLQLGLHSNWIIIRMTSFYIDRCRFIMCTIFVLVPDIYIKSWELWTLKHFNSNLIPL